MYPVLNSPRKIKIQPDFSTIYAHNMRVQVNESAVSILQLCDGNHSVQDIIDKLVIKYSEREDKVTEFVNEFLDYSARIETITYIKQKFLSEIKLFGSSIYWTPDMVVIELTHKCPLFCKHCYLDAGDGTSMKTVLINQLSDELINIGVDIIQLTGGEPLVYPNIENIITFFSKNGICLSITTSGVIDAPKIIESLELIKINNGWVQVSLDGLEDTHNRMRGNPNVYSKAVKFIQRLISMGINVHIATCATPDSINELESLCQYVKAWGVRCHRIGVVSQRGRAAANNLEAPLEFRQFVVDLRRRLKANYDSPTFTVSGFEDDIPADKRGMNCGAGYRTVKISPDGKIHPCPLMNHPVGDLARETLRNFAEKNSSVFAAIQSPNVNICGACSKLPLCKDCMAEALLYSNAETNCSWVDKQSLLAKFPGLS